MKNEDNSDSELAQIKQEYQDYAYIVSHDLSAPIRHIKEITRLLIDSTQRHLGDEERQYVKFLELSLRKLDAMQVSLLEFSRINTQGMPFEEMSSKEVLEKALVNMPNFLAEHRFCVRYDALPTVWVDARQCHHLFRYLIENALKFHDENASREVTVTAQQQDDGRILFEIRDNGIGIAEEYCEEVFQLFRKLHVEEKYPGIGAGLALARKIVNRHGGKIWIESAENEGASIFFTLPAPEKGS